MPMDNGEVRRLAASIGQAGSDTGARAQLVVRKTAKDVERDGKLIARQKGVYEFGNLIRSITTSDLRRVGQSGTLSVDIGPTVHYGRYQEEGTSRIPGRPYMAPAADRHAEPFAEAMARLGEEALGGD